MNMKRFLSLFLSMAMILTLVLWASPTVSADYAGVDYSRFHYGTNGRVYPASLTIGDIKFSGSLRCTNNFDLSDVNDAIRELFEATGLSEKDIVDANQKIKTAEKDRQFTYEDKVRWVSNMVKILGGSTALEIGTFVVEDICKIVLSDNKGEAVVDTVIDAVIQEMNVVGNVMTDAALETICLQYAEMAYEAFAEQLTDDWGKLGKINPVSILVELLKVSYQEYRLDVERWKRRVDAVNAKDFLDSFYDAVNMLLEQREGSSGTWQLKIVSTRDRYFSFWGSENNLQRWSVVVNMYGESTSTVSPKGEFEGVVALYANHNMLPFDTKLWFSEFGRFKEGWLGKVINTGFYKVTMGGGTHISRSIVIEDASFRITASDLITTFSSRAKGLPMRIRFDSTSFDIDEVCVISNRNIKVETSVGFEDANDNLTGYVVVDMMLHAQGVPGGGDGIQIYRDRAYGDVGILFFGQTQADLPEGVEAEIWDANIWKPLEGGITLHIGG